MQTGLDTYPPFERKTGLKGFVETLFALSNKRKTQILACALVILFLFSMCVRMNISGFISPIDAIKNIYYWIHFSLADQFNWAISRDRIEISNSLNEYYGTVSRFKVSVITLLCGMMLALAGNIFQSVFRNPIAAPSMLGVATGVRLGIIILVLKYEFAANLYPLEKYKYCYIAALVMLMIILVIAKLSSGKKKFSVFDLLIVAAIISQTVNGVVSYYIYGVDNDIALLIQELSNVMVVNIEPISFEILGVVALITIVPFYLIRFSFNAVCFDNEESSSMGVNTRFMKFFSLVLGSLMVTAGMVHCGSVGMISLIVPFISRAFFGAESRKMFWGNILIGGFVLLLCRNIAALIPFGFDGFPIGAVVEFLALPIFILILTSGRRTWE